MLKINKNSRFYTKHLLLGASILTLGIMSSPNSSYAQAMCDGLRIRDVKCHDHEGNDIDINICLRLSHEATPYVYETPLMAPRPAETEHCDLSCAITEHDGPDGCGCGDPNAPGSDCDNSSGSSGGDGGGGGGGCVLCGYFFNRGILSANIYQGDLAFANQHVSEATKRGYRLWAVPLTEYLSNNPNGLAEKIVQPFVVSWATEMAHRTGYSNHGHWLGKLQLSLLKPIVNFIGIFSKNTNWLHLKSEIEITKKMDLLKV